MGRPTQSHRLWQRKLWRMTQKKEPYLPGKRLSKDEQTDLAAREILQDERVAREEKTKRLKMARLKREVDQ